MSDVGANEGAGDETPRAAATPTEAPATPSAPFGINAVPLPRPLPEKRAGVPPPASAKVRRIEAVGDWSSEDCKAITDKLAELDVDDPMWGKKLGEICSVLEYYEQQSLHNKEDVYNARLKEVEKLGERKKPTTGPTPTSTRPQTTLGLGVCVRGK